MGGLSPTHWLIVVVVLVALFGAKRLPDAARGLGRSMRIFKAEIGTVANPSAPASDRPSPSEADRLTRKEDVTGP